MLSNKMSALFWSGLFAYCITWTPTVLAQNQPVITKNYAAEYNALFENMPEAKKAWPKYRAALARLSDEIVKQRDWCSVLIAENKARDFVRKNRDVIAEIRAATKLESLGHKLSNAVPDEDVKIFNEESAERVDNPELMSVTFVPLMQLAETAKLLNVEMKMALAESDLQLFIEDFEAICNMALQVNRTEIWLCQNQAFEMLHPANDQVLQALGQANHQFNDTQLIRIATALNSVANEMEELHFEFDQYVFLDFVQRNFTLDEDGNGNYINPSTKRLNRVVADRKSTIDTYKKTWKLILDDTNKPVSELNRFKGLDELIKLKEKPKFTLVAAFIPAYVVGYVNLEVLKSNLAASRIALACRRYHLKNEKWPKEPGQLTPEFINALPSDNISGKAFEYRLNDGKPQLVAVALDKTTGSDTKLINVDWTTISDRINARYAKEITYLNEDWLVWQVK